jgi:hypothetical protein
MVMIFIMRAKSIQPILFFFCVCLCCALPNAYPLLASQVCSTQVEYLGNGQEMVNFYFDNKNIQQVFGRYHPRNNLRRTFIASNADQQTEKNYCLRNQRVYAYNFTQGRLYVSRQKINHQLQQNIQLRYPQDFQVTTEGVLAQHQLQASASGQCIIQVVNNSRYTTPVSFYLKRVHVNNELGTYSPRNNQQRVFQSQDFCLNKDYVLAVTANNYYRSKRPINSRQQAVTTLEFPKDFQQTVLITPAVVAVLRLVRAELLN